jgi:glycosyltransferase involved in cell wall biosynthesis
MKVSVIVPTYNRGNKMVDTVKSIENNDFPRREFELILVNDNSPDDTEEIIKNLQKRYKNIKYMKNEKNLGPAAARNRGIKSARGKYIFFTDDDCLVPRNWLKTYVSFLDKHKNVVGTGGILQPASNNLVARIEILKDKVLGIKANKIMIGRQEVPMGFTNNTAYRKEVFKKVGYFNEKFKIPGGEDPELKSRVVKQYDVAFIPLKVKHNHNYNLDYLSGTMIKQGLERMPPKQLYKKIIMLLILSPLLVYNIIRKTIGYRLRGKK